MNLRNKAQLWISMLVIAASANAVIGIYTLRELNRITVLSIQEYEIELNVRRLRSLLSGYHQYLYLAALRRHPRDILTRDKYRVALEAELKAPEPLAPNKQQQSEYKNFRNQVLNLLAYMPRIGVPASESSLSGFYRSRVQDIESSIEILLSSHEAQMIAARDEVHEFYRRAMITLVTAVITSLSLLASGGVFLRYRVLVPFDRIKKLVENINSGDLSVRWLGSTSDEIGQIGATLNRLTEQLEIRRIERIETIGAVAHDLRNPISSLSMECELLRRHPALLTPDQAPRVVSRIERQVEKLWRLSEDLLQAAKQARSKWLLIPSEIALNALVSRTIEDFKIRFTDHNYRFSPADSEPVIIADQGRIEQVLENLIENATKYSDKGTEIEAKIADLGAEVEIHVLDRGIGISEQTRAEIFRSFGRGEAGREFAKGTGLGLAICREIIELHGGAIGVSSREGGGSDFKVLLPKRPPGSQRSEVLGRVA